MLKSDALNGERVSKEVKREVEEKVFDDVAHLRNWRSRLNHFFRGLLLLLFIYFE